jgi:3-oxoacyl-[acyl-carrier-protein] synthase III
VKVDLAIIGQGAVTPAGIGVEALLRAEPKPQMVAPLSRPNQSWPVLRVDLKDPAFSRWQREPRLRRASPITFYLIEAAEQALAKADAARRAETGLIVAFSSGCLAYSRRFFEGIVKQGQKTASPALFPETVFNSPASHIASVLGLDGAAYALVGDESAWVAAMKTAATWLKRGRVKQVLILGAEEFDPVVLDAYGSACWLGRHGFLTSEGAAGILVRAVTTDDDAVISTARDGFIYRTKLEADAAAGQMLSKTDPTLRHYPTAQHNWVRSIEATGIAGRTIIDTRKHPYLGEAFTASAAWNTIRAVHHLEAGPLLLPVWGLNHQFASLEFEKRK